MATEFQSPSRGGRLCDRQAVVPPKRAETRFSPLHEGDASVTLLRWLREDGYKRFSPLHEGDASVTPADSRPPAPRCPRFSPLHEGDASVTRRRAPITSSRRTGFSPLH